MSRVQRKRRLCACPKPESYIPPALRQQSRSFALELIQPTLPKYRVGSDADRTGSYDIS